MYIVIQDWMCNQLNLKSNELLIYALIYGYSQDGEGVFNGNRKYIATSLNISLPTVDKALTSLKDKQLIDCDTDNRTYWKYFATVWYKETLQGGVKKLYRGCKETLHNNNIINTDNKVLSKDNTTTPAQKSNKKSLYDKCIDLITEFTDDEILKDMLVQFLKNCLQNCSESGRTFYTNMFKGKINLLSKLSDDNYVQRKIVRQSLDNGWANFYALKNNNNPEKRASARSCDYTDDELSRLEKQDDERKRRGLRTVF